MIRRKYAIRVLFVILIGALALITSVSRAYTGPAIKINELLVGNNTTNIGGKKYTNFSSWVEMYNAGNTTVNLSGYYLSSDLANNKMWKIFATGKTATLKPGNMAIFYLDPDGPKDYAKLDMDMRRGEIGLFTSKGELVDSVSYSVLQQPDVSLGRYPDGSDNWAYFDVPTPAMPNSSDRYDSPTNIATPPTFSPAGGFYAPGQKVTLSTSEQGATIRYTLDGSKPTATSPVYTGPITLNKPTAVRARVFTPNKLDSQPATHTYLIGVVTELTVISLATEPANFFDPEIGIYVVGRNGAKNKGCLAKKANYFQSWERTASIEMYEPDGTRAFQQNVGVEIHGNCTRIHPRKSLEIKAKRVYGDNDIDYQIFPDMETDEWKRIILRNSGNRDWAWTVFRDSVVQQLVQGYMDVDYQEYRPAVLFINGEYWGIHNMRPKADEMYPDQIYGYDRDTEIDFIEDGRIVEAGNMDLYKALQADLKKDLTVPANYNAIVAQVDVNEMMNYFIHEIYAANRDWPARNIRVWRPKAPDGQWRWIMYDMDEAFLPHEYKDDTLYRVLHKSHRGHANVNTYILRRMMTNSGFRNEFLQRFASHLNITYDPVRVNAVITDAQNAIESEMPNHIARWLVPESMPAWYGYIDVMRSFANLRPDMMRTFLDKEAGKNGYGNLTVNVAGGGKVLVANVAVPSSSYTGQYLRKIPITLTAVEEDGKEFVQWDDGNTSPTRVITLNSDAAVTATFRPANSP